MNQKTGTKILLLGLFFGISGFVVWELSEKPVTKPMVPAMSEAIPESPKALIPVQILEKGHPPKTVFVPVSATSIPEINTLLLAPLGWLLLLRRQR